MRFVVLILLAVALGAASPLGDADSDPVALITAIYESGRNGIRPVRIGREGGDGP
jgi:hypothetical protein